MNSLNKKHGYIYLLQDGCFHGTNVFKIGRTSQIGDTKCLSRIKSYSQNTTQVYLREVCEDQVINIERDIIKLFRSKYILIKGREWFEGSSKSMIEDIHNIIKTKYSESEIIKPTIFNKNEPINNVVTCLYECNVCGKSYIHRSRLRNHLDKHKEENSKDKIIKQLLASNIKIANRLFDAHEKAIDKIGSSGNNQF